jgi:hypothetical protein
MGTMDLMWMLIIDINLVNYSCSLQCIEKIYLTKGILIVGILKDKASWFYRFLVYECLYYVIY